MPLALDLFLRAATGFALMWVAIAITASLP